MALKIISIFAGTDSDFNGVATLAITNLPYTGFLPGDVISAFVYSGENQPILFSPSVSWVSAPAGSYVVKFLAANTSTIVPGRYTLRVLVTRAADARIIPIMQAWIQIKDSPGTATTLTNYCTLQDVLNYAPWLEKEQTSHALSGFSDHRHLARTWLESVIQSKNLNSGIQRFGSDIIAFFNPANYGGDSKWLQTQLDNNLLMIKPKTLEIVCRKTIQVICESAISPTVKDQPYRDYARYQKMEVDRLIKTYIAEFDFNGDGYTDYVVNCSLSTLAN